VDLTSTEVKIFGERNTGTNALKSLIETNSKSRVAPSVAKELDSHFEWKMRVLRHLPKPIRASLTERYIDSVFKRMPPRLAWKHTATRFNDVSSLADCSVIVTIRNPLSWVLGLHRHPHNAISPVPQNFSAFVQAPWRLCRRDNLGETEIAPMEMWNQKAKHMIGLVEQLERRNLKSNILKFEDFVTDQEASFGQVASLLNAPAECPKIVQGSTKDRAKDHAYYRDYYAQEKWLSEIEPNALEIIIRLVDWGIASTFGYRRPSL
jgi:hypothetical protein